MHLPMISKPISLRGRKQRRRDTFWQLAQNHTQFLYNVALKYAGNPYDAEDLVQETLYTAYHKFEQLRDSRKFKSWMFAILRNHFLKWQRKKTPIPATEFEDGIDYVSELESAAIQPDAASIVEKKQEAEKVQSILDTLPEKYKTVLILHYLEDSSYQETADILGVPIGTIMSRLSRAKQAMKKALLRSMRNAPQSEKVIRLNQLR